MTLTIYEIFNKINSAQNPEEELRKYITDTSFKRWLIQVFDPRETFAKDLGIGYPPLVRMNRRLADFISDTSMRYEIRKLYVFQEKKQLLPKRRLQLFTQLCEGLHYKEADLLIQIKDGEFSKIYPNVTEQLVRKVFPNLLTFVPSEIVKQQKIEIDLVAGNSKKMAVEIIFEHEQEEKQKELEKQLAEVKEETKIVIDNSDKVSDNIQKPIKKPTGRPSKNPIVRDNNWNQLLKFM